MKIRIPGKEVEACDLCSRDGHGCLTTCVVCGNRYCHTCEAIVMGCIHQPELCRACGDNGNIRAAIGRYVPKLTKLLEHRNAAMKAAAKIKAKPERKPNNGVTGVTTSGRSVQ